MYHAENKLFSEPLMDYLKHRGWTVMESEPDIAVLRNVEEEIVLPIDRTYADYDQRVREAIQFLAKYEAVSEKSVIDAVLFQQWDILRIRISGDHIGNGSISFLDKGVIEEGLRKVLLASARSVEHPRPYYKRLYSSSVDQWMKKCRSVAAESGSFILTVHLPLEKDPENREPPVSRLVGEYLMHSLHHLMRLSEHPDLTVDEEHFHLNANFCLGLAEMKPDASSSIRFDFEMKWSSGIPVREKVPTQVAIQDSYFPAIERIGQRLKPPTEVNQDMFVGKVWALQGQTDESGNMQGEIILILFVDEAQSKAKVSLNPDWYAHACDAHKHNQYVRISGVLFEKPRCSDLKDVSSFEILK